MRAAVCGQPEGILPPVTSGKLCTVYADAGTRGLHISPHCQLHPAIHVLLRAWGKVLESCPCPEMYAAKLELSITEHLLGLLLQATTARDSGWSWEVSSAQLVFNDIAWKSIPGI